MKPLLCPPTLSVVIPFYNRSDTIGYTLESVARAREGLAVEVLIVDDGSTPPAADVIGGFLGAGDRIIRQENQGLLFARLTGLREAAGEYVLFLDSDDLVSAEKFKRQLAAMQAANAEVSYTDIAETELGSSAPLRVHEPAETTGDGVTFFIRVQPAPHSPIFRAAWLQALVKATAFRPSRHFNPVAEIWFYHVAALHPARVIKVPGPHTIIGHHGGSRLTGNWERLAVASLAVMERFQRSCPVTPETQTAHRLVGEKAFESWRRLPYDFYPEFRRRLLAVWKRAPRGEVSALGGGKFTRLAKVVGPVGAGWFLRRMTGGPYAGCRTLADDATFHGWMQALEG